MNVRDIEWFLFGLVCSTLLWASATLASMKPPAVSQAAEVEQLQRDLREAEQTLQATPQCRRFWRDGRGML